MHEDHLQPNDAPIASQTPTANLNLALTSCSQIRRFVFFDIGKVLAPCWICESNQRREVNRKSTSHAQGLDHMMQNAGCWVRILSVGAAAANLGGQLVAGSYCSPVKYHPSHCMKPWPTFCCYWEGHILKKCFNGGIDGLFSMLSLGVCWIGASRSVWHSHLQS